MPKRRMKSSSTNTASSGSSSSHCRRDKRVALMAAVIPTCLLVAIAFAIIPQTTTAWVFPVASTVSNKAATLRSCNLITMASASDGESSQDPSFGPRKKHSSDCEEEDEDMVNGEDVIFSKLKNNPNNNNSNINTTQAVLKRLKVAKAQEEIDRILQGPDAPIDTEAELEKVVSMTTTPSEHPLLDAEMAQLESELYQAVKQQDFTLASTKKAQLRALQHQYSSPRHHHHQHPQSSAASTSSQHSSDSSSIVGAASTSSTGAGENTIDDGGAILQVNAAFYRAFSKKSWSDMQDVWLSHDDPGACVCIHPSHKPLVGTRRISRAWQQMFASTDGSFQRNWMEPHQIRIMMKGSHMAIVTCEEHVFARRFVRGQKRQTELINKLLATNIFRKVGDRWYMFYHHASWHPDSDAAKRALSTNGAAADEGSGTRVVPDELTPWQRMTLMRRKRDLRDLRRRHMRQWEDKQDDNNDPSMDGILGSDFGPILGDGDKKNGGSKETPFKQIIMGGSLSDLLGPRGLGNLLGGNENSSGPKNIGKNSKGIPGEGAIIRFSRIEMNEEDEDDDEEDDDEDDDDDLDLDDIEIVSDDEDDDDDDDDDAAAQAESVTIIKEWAKSSAKRDNQQGEMSQMEKAAPSAEKKGSKGFFKDTLRQNCISALRKLCDQGTISPKQKRVLLTDIITCSSKGDFSMVEVAYELLCGEVDADEEDTAEEEFAEQCRVFAQERLKEGESDTPTL